MTERMSSSELVQTALAERTRRGVRRVLGYRRPSLTLPEIQRLSRHLASLGEERRPLRVGILRTYTTELLRPHWALESALAGMDLDLYEAPLGSLLQEGQSGSALLRHEPEATFLLMQWADLDPRFSALGEPSAGEHDELAAAAERRLAAIVEPLRAALPGLLVVALISRPGSPEPESSLTPSIRAKIADAVRGLPAAHFFDVDEKLGSPSGSAYDLRLWETARFPFSVAGAQSLVEGLFTLAFLAKGPLVKCVVVDADNTLWGGVVGEDGPEGLSLGPDRAGAPYVEFQRRLLKLRERGILLALCSRNNWSDVRQILEAHPHQVLRQEHFAALRVNWEPKPENLRSIAAELNLGLESLLFVDDSPQECLFAEQSLPELTVIRLPESPTEIPLCLEGVPGLERLSLTEEDSVRARYYTEDRQRRRLEVESATVNEYLAALRMVMTVGMDDPSAVARIAQLTQRTNQFNVTTRRYTEAEIHRWVRDPEWLVAHFSLADVFGDAGVVGAALVRGLSASDPEFDTFLLSCRVIGRGAETAFLEALLDWLRGRGAERALGHFVPSAKNALVADFWTRQGFRERSPGLYERDLAALDPVKALPPISVIMVDHTCSPARQKE
jgi:FkbH-like protein